ncbi:MAG: hypothetical protein HWE26_20885 [Alteromonadaceae bacterium]|nr:hypothetical protein [Alteromonadaceae bacterium]
MYIVFVNTTGLARTLGIMAVVCCLSSRPCVAEQTASEEPVSDATQPHSWLDRWHSNFSESMHYTAQQLDDFFALETSNKHQEARAEGRVRFGWEPRSTALAEQDFRFRIRVKLPALEDRVDLLLSDDDSFNQDDSIRAARDSVDDAQNSATLALRYQKQQDSSLSYRVGAGRRGQLFVKTEYDQNYAFNDAFNIDYDAELYYYTRDELGAELGLNFNFSLANDNYLRFRNRYFYRDRFNDWFWRHEIQLLRPVSQQSAVLFRFVTNGVSRPNHQLGEVYTSARWRTNYLRSWLFFELEPFVIWLREEDFNASVGVAMRFEFYYGKI